MTNQSIIRPESQEIMSELFESAPDAMLVVDERGLIVRINYQTKALFGYEPQELLDKPVEILLPERFRRRHIAHRTAYMSEPRLRPMGADLELYGLHKDGSELPINIMLSSLAAGEGTFVIAVIRDITERKQAEARIRASLQEKEVMLKEIHHRVKNNLQIVSSLLKLQAGYVESPQTLTVLQESQNRIRAMALVHETLYQSQDLASIDFAQYLQQLVSHLSKAYAGMLTGVIIELDIGPIRLDLDTAVSCGLIVNELVSNALKYAFPSDVRQAGEIKITLHQDKDDQIILEIQDNGIGFPQDLDFRQTESLGLQLVNTLVIDELDGTIVLEQHNGTIFTVILPYPPSS
jgi:PAS domain S-box-containing protein